MAAHVRSGATSFYTQESMCGPSTSSSNADTQRLHQQMEEMSQHQEAVMEEMRRQHQQQIEEICRKNQEDMTLVLALLSAIES
jgi:hypothetical protein